MLSSTGRKENLSVCSGSEIEVSAEEEYVWYRAILLENLPKSKRKKVCVRHLHPLLNQHYSPPLLEATFHRHIRPLPPPDLFPPSIFEEGDAVDAAYKGGWSCGFVVRLLGHHRYLVNLQFEPDVIVFDRKDLRPHLVWKDEEWFRCEKRDLIESDFSAGKEVEVRREIEHLGDVWAPAIAIKENDDGTLLVKLKSFKADECTKISFPFSKIRPSPPHPSGSIDYKLMQKVDALVEHGWCPAMVYKLHTRNIYTVLLGHNKETKEVTHLHLRPSLNWIHGVWQSQAKVLNGEESPHAPQETTRIRVTIPTASKNQKAAMVTIKNIRATRSSTAAMQKKPLPAYSNEDVALLRGESGNTMDNPVINENTPDTSKPETAAAKEFHPSIVLGVAATQLTKPAVKTQGKTTPRKKLQAMTNQNGSVRDKAPVETRSREGVNKRKRGQPRKFISTEPKQKTGGNGSKFQDIAVDDQPLASWIHCGNSSGQSASQTPDPMLNSVVETPPARDSTMVLPFAKKSPLWKVIESMDVFKAVPQQPHFSPLAEKEEESREGDAIGAMVTFSGLLENVKNMQVDSPVSSINRVRECFLKLEKHGFDVTAPRSRLDELLSIKERQTRALEELRVVEREITEKDNKRRKCEEDIKELSKKIVELRGEKESLDKEIVRMKSHAMVLDHKVQDVEQVFQATVAAPWSHNFN